MLVPRDTSSAARRRQIDAIRAIASADRLRIADALSTEVRTLSLAGIRRRLPDASAELVARLLAERMLGRDGAVRAQGTRIATDR